MFNTFITLLGCNIDRLNNEEKFKSIIETNHNKQRKCAEVN